MPVHLLSVLEHAPVLLYVGTALVGVVVGSFLNVLILRLPRIMEQQWRADCDELLGGEPAADATAPLSLSHPGSHCPACGTAIKPWDNIPVLSFMLLRGRCRACRTRISLRYPLIEALTAALSVVVAWQFGLTATALAALLLTWGLIALSVIDLETQLLPDGLTLPLLWLGLLFSLTGELTNPASAIIGASVGYLLLWLVFHAFRIATGKDGMGRGDFKLLAVFGAWLGWQAIPQILLLSALPGALVGIALIVSGRQQGGQPIPFGPFLAIAGWISLLWGDAITGAYLHWAGLA